MHKHILTLDEWEDIFQQLDELHDEFIIKYNRIPSHFRYKKDYLENENEKDLIVTKAVRLIRTYSLFDMLIEEDLKLKDENDKPLYESKALKDYYDGNEMYNHSVFLKYSSSLTSIIKKKINFLSKKD